MLLTSLWQSWGQSNLKPGCLCTNLCINAILSRRYVKARLQIFGNAVEAKFRSVLQSCSRCSSWRTPECLGWTILLLPFLSEEWPTLKQPSNDSDLANTVVLQQSVPCLSEVLAYRHSLPITLSQVSCSACPTDQASRESYVQSYIHLHCTDAQIPDIGRAI